MENTPTPAPVKVSHKPSITGIVLAILSLILSGLGNFLITMKYTPTGPTTGSVESEVGHAVGTGTTAVLGALLGVPFLVGGLVIAGVSILFILFRLRKVRIAGLLLSIVAVLLVIWSVSIVLGAFELIKAQPAN